MATGSPDQWKGFNPPITIRERLFRLTVSGGRVAEQRSTTSSWIGNPRDFGETEVNVHDGRLSLLIHQLWTLDSVKIGVCL
jgi:hypothetical protein